MKNRIRKLLMLGIAGTMIASSALGVSAVGLKDVFSAKYYAESYSDLKKAFGNDEEALYNHFLNYGLKEGRQMSLILDVRAYRAAYPDLDAAFGDDWDAYVEHFFAHGAAEGRTEGVLFNPVEYAKAYPDIAAAFNGDLAAIAEHYVNFGIAEGRTAGTADAAAEEEDSSDDSSSDDTVSTVPTAKPTSEPTAKPTSEPTAKPTSEPTAKPTSEPTAKPTSEPTAKPTSEPTAKPTAEPTAKPTAEPTAKPTAEPTAKPTAEPTAKPTAEPTAEPTAQPTAEPTAQPTASPEPTTSPEPSTTPAPIKVYGSVTVTGDKISSLGEATEVTVTGKGTSDAPYQAWLRNIAKKEMNQGGKKTYWFAVALPSESTKQYWIKIGDTWTNVTTNKMHVSAAESGYMTYGVGIGESELGQEQKVELCISGDETINGNTFSEGSIFYEFFVNVGILGGDVEELDD